MRLRGNEPDRRLALRLAVGILILLTATGAGSQDPPPEPDPSPSTPAESEPDDPEPDAESLEDPLAASPPNDDDPLGFPVHGFLSARYRLRATNDTSDQDVYGHLQLDAGDPARNPVTVHLFLRGTADIDGFRDRTGFYVFDSITDTYDERYNGRFYYGYVDFHTLDFLEIARVGRQLTYETPVPYHFDGARLETRELLQPVGLKAGIYGGLPVHLFESSPNGDQIIGAYASLHPWPDARVRLDWTGVRDDLRFDTEDNEIWAVSGWQNFGPQLSFYGRYSRLENSSLDVDARVTYLEPELNLQMQFSYFHLLSTQRRRATEFDPYFESLQDYLPYRLYSGTVFKGFGDHFGLTVGFAFRELEDDDDESTFNHEYFHGYLIPAVQDFPWDGFHAEVSADLWDASDNRIRTIGGEISQEFAVVHEVALGSAYALYKYDFFLDAERDRTRSYYARWDWDATEMLGFRVLYEYERDSFDEYHTLDVRATLQF